MLTRDPAAPPPPLPPSHSLFPSHPHSTDLAKTREASVLPGLGGRTRNEEIRVISPSSACLPSPLLSVDRSLLFSVSCSPPPPSAASRQVLPPTLPLQSPGFSPSRLGCRGQGWGLLLALTGPSWGQERNGQRALTAPALPRSPPPQPQQFLSHKVDSCKEFPRLPTWISLLLLPELWMAAVGQVKGSVSGGSEWEGERQDRRQRWGQETEKRVQK